MFQKEQEASLQQDADLYKREDAVVVMCYPHHALQRPKCL